MAQATDLELAGAGYMVAPGAYRRIPDPATSSGQAGKAGRINLDNFTGGLGQAIAPTTQPEAPGRGWGGVAVRSVLGGQGVEPWGSDTVYADTMVDQPAVTVPAQSLIVGDTCYVAVGRRLYASVALTNGTWANLTVAADLGAGVTISGLSRYKDDLLLFCGANANIRKYRTDTQALVNPWVAGEKGIVGVGYRGQVLFATGQANDTYQMRMTVDKFDGTLLTRKRYADAPIVSMGTFQGKVVVATKNSLMTFGGDWTEGDAGGAKADWSGELEGLFTHGTWTAKDDFVFLLGYGGRLYTWLANRVVEWDPTCRGRGWRQVGPEGKSCYGGCVAGGYLFVTLDNRDGEGETWVFDGAGWWRFHAAATPTACWPTNARRRGQPRPARSSATRRPATTSTGWSGARRRCTPTRTAGD